MAEQQDSAGLAEEVGAQPSPEEAAHLAQLAASIADEPALSVEVSPGQVADSLSGGERPAVPPNAEVNLAGLLELITLPLGELGYKKTAAVWTADACQKVAFRAVPVLNKSTFGRRFLAWLEDGFGVEELALLAVVAPLAMQTKAAILADVADMNKPAGEGGSANE